ncbi:hypothetical protein [Pseudohaliea sp.]|uniref:hypothetical protein n=1 Tax=Pseudohaliea sp. TaxID=2740289 RepID=UPI0032F07129
MTHAMPGRGLRRGLTLALLAAALLLPGAFAKAGEETAPGLLSILAATVTTPALEDSVGLYRDALGYRVVERSVVSPGLARSWGAPAMAGRAQAVLAPASGEAVFLRLVAGTPVPGYSPLTTTGWNAIELLVQDPDAVARRLADTAFARLGAPAFLAPGSTIRATQFVGPAGEVFYFTADTGPAADSTLARARSAVDRPFILVLAGEDVDSLAAFYRERFALPQAFRSRLPIPIIARAQGRDENEDFPLVLLRLAAFSHSLELDGYGKAPARPTAAGELPPGVALATFLVADLDALGDLSYLAPPSVQRTAPYAGRRAATLRGPAGELVELVEREPVAGEPIERAARPD